MELTPSPRKRMNLCGECKRVTIDFGFTSDWMKRWREFFKANHVAWLMQNQLFFDTEIKTARIIVF